MRTGKRLLAMLLSAALLLASGCTVTTEDQGGSQEAQPPEASASEPAGEESEEPQEGVTTINYWSHNGEQFIEANKQIIAKFEEQNPDIKIKYDIFPFNELQEKMKASYAAGAESDCQQIFGTWAVQYTKNGMFSEVPFLTMDQVKESYFEPTYAGYTYEDKLYGLPREFSIENGGVLYYPEDLKAAGYDEFPKTYDELIDAAKKCTQYDSGGNITHVGFDMFGPDNVPYTFISFLLQYGGNYWTEDGHVNFTSPESIKGMQSLVDLVLTHKVTDTKHISESDDLSEYFFKGGASMCIIGPWTIATGVNQFELDNFDYGLMPSIANDSYAFASPTGWGEVVSARSKNLEATWKFIEFATNEENSLLFNDVTYTVPAQKAVANSPEFLEKKPMLAPSIKVLPEGIPIGPFPNAPFFKKTVYDHFVRICNGEETVEQACENIENEINRDIDDSKLS